MTGEPLGELVIRFIEKLKITIGKDEGKNFILRDWQQAFIRDVFDPIGPTGNRLVRRAVLSIARKNGKTELAAALVLAFLIGPAAELNGEIYSAANDRNQASIVFRAVCRMVEANPKLRKRLTIVKSTKTIFVKEQGLKGSGSKFQALSADAGRQHGLNPSFVIYDELAQAKKRELLDTLLTSQGARANPLFLTISTQNNDPKHPLSEMIDDGLRVDDDGNKKDPTVVCHLYAADDDCDLLDRDQWAKANPALGDFRDLEEFEVMAARAARLSSEEQSFRLLYLNQRVSLHSSLISRSEWKACTNLDEAGQPTRCTFVANHFDQESKRAIDGEDVYLGLDMSRKHDLTALVMVSAHNGSRIDSWFWKPEDCIEEHTKRDGVRYDLAVKDGDLLTCSGKLVNPRDVGAKVAELHKKYNILGLAYDRYRTEQLLNYFEEIGLEAQEGSHSWTGGLRVVPWGQGPVDMAPAIDAFEEAILTGDLRHGNQPLLTSCVMHALVVADEKDNRKFDKRKSTMRIDGAVALAMALGLKARDRVGKVVTSPWEDENFSIQVV
jgi:phage terminase large subunit-like protein